MSNLIDQFSAILAWSHSCNIIEGSTAKDQFMKFISERGEFEGHMYQFSEEFEGGSEESELHKLMADDIGDMTVCLINVAAQLDIDAYRVFELFDSGEWPLSYIENDLDGSDEFNWQVGKWSGKLADAILKKRKHDAEEAIGHILVFLKRLCGSWDVAYGYTYEDAVAMAYDEIKDRKGVMFNGTFIKSTDEAYEGAIAELNAKKEAGSV